MSLINQMLKDLEKRQKSSKTAAGNVLQGISSAAAFDASHINKKLWVGIIGVFVISLVVISKIEGSAEETYASPSLQGKKVAIPAEQPVIDPDTKSVFDSITASNAPEEILPQATPATDHTTTPASFMVATTDETTSQAADVPVSLNKVDWQVGQHAMTMELHLQKQVPYDVVIDDANNVITMTLAHATFLGTQPLTMTRNAFVSDLTTEQEGTFLKLKVHLHPNVHLQSVDYLSETTEPTLVMALVSDGHFPKSAMVESAQTAAPSEINKVMVPLTRDQRAEIARQDAIALMNKGNSDGAITLLENAVASHPDYLLARETLASVLMDKGDLAYAKELLVSGRNKAPHYLPFVLLQARIDIAENKLSEAEDVLHTVSPTIEESPDYVALEASIAQRLGKYAESEQLYADLVRNDPANGAWWMGYGISLEGTSKDNAALVAYKRALQTNNLSSQLRAYTNQRIVSLGG